MKQFEATFTISIKSDGLEEIEAKNQASAENKLEAKIQQFIKNNNLESIAMDFNSTLEIESHVSDLLTVDGWRWNV